MTGPALTPTIRYNRVHARVPFYNRIFGAEEDLSSELADIIPSAADQDSAAEVSSTADLMVEAAAAALPAPDASGDVWHHDNSSEPVYRHRWVSVSYHTLLCKVFVPLR